MRSLEIHVYGPGFGETIFLRWPARRGSWQGALIDAYSPDDGAWVATKLQELGLRELEFVVATHPHLDHIQGLAAGLDRAGVRARNLYYWPGISAKMWIQFFDRLAAQRGGDLPTTAEMVRQWFAFCGKHYQWHGIPGGDTGGAPDFPNIYSAPVGREQLLVKAIGPWLVPMNKLVRNVSESIERNGTIHYEHRHANHVSIGLLIEFGKAQVILGGDMEDINWKALLEQPNRPKLTPSVVKVSHHGSSNGRVAGMWRRGCGFVDGMPKDPIAVVTPWTNGSNFLPDGDVVLNEICEAGYSVYVTGHCGAKGRPTRHNDSHVRIGVKPDGGSTVLEMRKVRTMAPVPI